MKTENEKLPSDNGLGDPQLPPLEGEHLGPESQGQEQAQSAGMADLFSMLFAGLSGFVAARKGEHWNATPEEVANFGKAADRVAALYMDGQQPSPWLGLMLVVGIYAAPRAMMDAHRKKQEQEKQDDAGESARPN